MKKKNRRVYSILTALAIMLNVLVPNLAYAQESVAKSNTITVSVERRVLGQADIVEERQFALNSETEKTSHVFDRLMKEEGIIYENTGDLDTRFYISSINTPEGPLGETDHGHYSGWKYRINGVEPDQGLSDTQVKAGDILRITYSAKDMGPDIDLVDSIYELRSVISSAQGIDQSRYSPESVAVLQEAITLAQNSNYTNEQIGQGLSNALGLGDWKIAEKQGKVDTAINSLNSAINSLVEVIPEYDLSINMLKMWSEYDTIYLRENQESVSVRLEMLEVGDTVTLNGQNIEPKGGIFVINLKNNSTNKLKMDFGAPWGPDILNVNVKSLPYEIKGNLVPGGTVTVKFKDLGAQLIGPNYTELDQYKIKSSQTIYETDIPNIENVSSNEIHGRVPDKKGLSTVTFTIPEDTQPGEYSLTGGTVYHKWSGGNIGSRWNEAGFSKLPDITINISDKIDESKIHDIDLTKWSKYDAVYTEDNNAYVRINNEVKELHIGKNVITIDGTEYAINCKKVTYEVEKHNQIIPGSKVKINFNGIEEGINKSENINTHLAKTTFNTNIDGLQKVESENGLPMGNPEADRAILNTIEFTIPKNTTPGEYVLSAGNVTQKWYTNLDSEKIPGSDSIEGSMVKEFSKLPEIKIQVRDSIPTDTTAPKITTNLNNNGTSTSAKMYFTASATDDFDNYPTFVVKVNGEAVSATSGNGYYARLVEGVNEIVLTATDESQNKAEEIYVINCQPKHKEGNSIIFDKDYLELNVGQTHQIIAVDAPDSRGVETEDTLMMTYSVTEGNDVISVNKRGNIEALKPGIAKVSVTYAGLDKPGTVLVNVLGENGGDNSNIVTSMDDINKYDTVYYPKGNSSYEFTVDVENATNIEVKLNDNIIEPVENRYKGSLLEGNNIVKVKATVGSKVSEKYFNIKAEPVEVTVTNKSNAGKEIVQGDTVRVEFKGLETPVPKYLRVYNPKNTRVSYDTNMPGMTNIFGQGSQYDIATDNAIEFVATKAGDFKFTNGHIDEYWWGDKLFSERDISNDGPNMSAQVHHDKFSTIPSFELSVKENPSYTDKYSATVENKDNIKPGDEVVIKIDNLEIPDKDAGRIIQARTVFNTDIKGLEEVTSKEAIDNEANLKEIRFTIPKDTKPGTYTVTNGRVFKEWEPGILYEEAEFYKGELPEIKIEVKGEEVVPPNPTPDPIVPVDVTSGIKHASQWTLANVENPGYEDEWYVLGLARGSVEVPKGYYDTYYENLEKVVVEKKGNLHRSKYSEYSRVILALTAIGKDPTDVGGYNLVEKLYDYKDVSKQGINGIIFALIALDSANYEIPKDVNNSREKMVQEILNRQLEDGGFSLSGNAGDPDITGMALQALSKYKDQPNVKIAIDEALNFLASIQKDSGAFGNYEGENLESTVQVLVALNELGLSASDKRFIKNGNNVIDGIEKFRAEDGGYKHVLSESSANGMATEQALYGFVSQQRLNKGKSSLYTMSDAGEDVVPPVNPEPTPDPDVKPPVDPEPTPDPDVVPPVNPEPTPDPDVKPTPDPEPIPDPDKKPDSGKDDNNKSPQTSDASIMGLVTLSVISIASLGFINRKKIK